jgi:DNA-directed RNA polymerase subunit N (RpoN/RPB10)
MLIPIRCFTCGYPVGRVAVVFKQERAKLVETKKKEWKLTAAQVVLDTRFRESISSLLEDLGIPFEWECCRTRLTTAEEKDKYL